MKQVFSICLFFLLAGMAISEVNGQDNAMPGTVITLSGDTLSGNIIYNQRDFSPKTISFCPTGEKEFQVFHPLDIQSFAVNGESYVGAVVQSEISPRSTNELTSFADLQFSSDTVFLQQLVSGAKSLFYYKNQFGQENFYIFQNQAFDWLIYKKYLQTENGQSRIVENNRFVGQLINYLINCPDIQQKAVKLRYSQNSLQEIFAVYYQCTGEKPVFQAEKMKLKRNFGFVGGVSSYTLQFEGGTFDYLSEVDFSNSVQPSLGLFLEIVLPRKQDKWSIYNDLQFSKLQVEGGYTDVVHQDRYTTYETEISCLYLNMSNLLRYRLPMHNMQLFLNAGISNGYALSNNNSVRSTLKFFDTTRIEENPAIDGIRKLETALLAGVGINYGKFSCEIRSAFGNGMSPYNGIKSNTRYLYFLLGYQFR